MIHWGSSFRRLSFHCFSPWEMIRPTASMIEVLPCCASRSLTMFFQVYVVFVSFVLGLLRGVSAGKYNVQDTYIGGSFSDGFFAQAGDWGELNDDLSPPISRYLQDYCRSCYCGPCFFG
ncbi:hypothetical protein BS47DRAFT_376079 [Hydnum rufescens UP504]|uniref:Uncharacterized protein n=1 Tax=Hydnum rufescens UP504 TaxID=1448309 RepID=A0A9P6E0I5_9AGAM|nr:hypothetical protein BS47DRAFT_376079 [Hydnum rufescens UP504]